MRYISAAFVIILTGCVSAPKGETHRVYSNLSYAESVNELRSLIEACWTRKSSLFGPDAIYGRASEENGVFVMTIGRDNSDIPFMPFARVLVKTNEDKVYYSVEEGSVFLTNEWNLSQSIEYWLAHKGKCLKPVSEQ